MKCSQQFLFLLFIRLRGGVFTSSYKSILCGTKQIEEIGQLGRDVEIVAAAFAARKTARGLRRRREVIADAKSQIGDHPVTKFRTH